MSTPRLRRNTTRLTIVTLIAMVLLAASPAGARSVNATPAPPQSNAYGLSLAEWMKLYFTWALGGAEADHVGNVRFLPLPQGEKVAGEGTYADPAILQGHLDITLAPGTAFVLPVIAWIGETYAEDTGIPDDQPLAASLFTDSDMLVTLDGKPILDSSRDNLGQYYVERVAFDEPIMYATPTDYGATGAIWIQGSGFVYRPLSAGTHTITLHSELLIPGTPGIGTVFDNTWTISVEAPSRSN